MVTRIISGIVGILLTTYVVTFGSWLFALAVLLLAGLAWHEFCNAFIHKNLSLAYFSGMLALFFLLGCAWMGNSEEILAVFTVTLLVILSQMIFRHAAFSVEQAFASSAGIFYIGISFIHLILLRYMGGSTGNILTPAGTFTQGEALLWLAFLGTWASDTFAYFTGYFLGRHKLCPDISPKKTIEGFAGGILGTVLVCAGIGSICSFSVVHTAVLGVLIALTATLGDLVESSIKRYTGIKDSGSLIPGHGGVLDRFDSIMFTVPLVYYYVQIFKIG